MAPRTSSRPASGTQSARFQQTLRAALTRSASLLSASVQAFVRSESASKPRRYRLARSHNR